MGIFERLPSKQPVTVSNEMIDTQKNDYIVPALAEAFGEIRKVIEEHEITSTLELVKNKNARPYINKLDSLLKERFGINFRHVGSESTAYAVFTTPPINFNTIREQNIELVEWLKGYIVDNDVSTNKADLISETQENKMLLTWEKSYDAIEKHMRTDSVIIDLHKAKVIGLPDDYEIMLLADFYTCMIAAELTDREMVGILMHEVGHAFTHLEYSYRTVRNTSVLVDSLQENLKLRNRPAKESIILAYEETFKTKMKPEESKNLVTATITVFNKYIEDANKLGETTHSYTDSEQLADQFSGRFGLGVELMSGLKSIMKFYSADYYKQMLMMSLTPLAYICILTILEKGLMAALITVLGVAMIWVIIGIVFVTIVSVIVSIVTLGGATEEKTYDDMKRRLMRMRNEGIRSLRLNIEDNKILKELIANIDSMDSLLLDVPEDKVGIMNSVVLFFSSKGQRLTELKKTEQLIEDLMENDLHLAAARLKIM